MGLCRVLTDKKHNAVPRCHSCRPLRRRTLASITTEISRPDQPRGIRIANRQKVSPLPPNSCWSGDARRNVSGTFSPAIKARPAAPTDELLATSPLLGPARSHRSRLRSVPQHREFGCRRVHLPFGTRRHIRGVRPAGLDCLYGFLLWGFPRVTAEGPAAPGAPSILIPLKKTSCFEGSLERFRRVLASPADGVPLPGAADIAGEQRGLGQ